ncbi:hypothetical protein VHEMI02422 [[Torrubiella] hemipterigena]|uniref:Uncharacterized protein n=1 Tax=[Torrubiella] hemipterigena TaxID=1531966 RepID=A0A0A1T7U1_9HYPO|nr:hypothetical protein VHEMI02422 [[Torrubiella] hemipterigena]
MPRWTRSSRGSSRSSFGGFAPGVSVPRGTAFTMRSNPSEMEDMRQAFRQHEFEQEHFCQQQQQQQRGRQGPEPSEDEPEPMAQEYQRMHQQQAQFMADLEKGQGDLPTPFRQLMWTRGMTWAMIGFLFVIAGIIALYFARKDFNAKNSAKVWA